jgi:tRNA dimethylallyltransferase
MYQSKKLIVVCGATASGKTAYAVKLAREMQCEILSADSRQFYIEMNIGTAKPTVAEQGGVKHHFIDNKHIWEDYNAGQFEHDALNLLKSIFFENDRAVLVGGSGLYIKALCEGFDSLPTVSESIRKEVSEDFQKYGLDFLLEELRNKDLDYFNSVDKQNHTRVMRALEIIRTSGKTYSEMRTGKKVVRPFDIEYIMLDWERDKLYERINLRVDAMMKAGLLEEVQSLLPFRQTNAMQTVGYREFLEYFDGKASLETAVELVKQHTRNYAKRQLTWFRQIKNLKVLSAPSFNS